VEAAVYAFVPTVTVPLSVKPTVPILVAVAVVFAVVGRRLPRPALFFSVLFEVMFVSFLPFREVSFDAAVPKTKTFVSRNESFVSESMMTSFDVPRDPSILFWRLLNYGRTTANNCVRVRQNTLGDKINKVLKHKHKHTPKKSPPK
jgi:hypothetical protein